MKIQIVESAEMPVGQVALIMAPADFVAYKEYLEKKKELEAANGGVAKVHNLIGDAFFTAEVESKD